MFMKSLKILIIVLISGVAASTQAMWQPSQYIPGRYAYTGSTDDKTISAYKKILKNPFTKSPFTVTEVDVVLSSQGTHYASYGIEDTDGTIKTYKFIGAQQYPVNKEEQKELRTLLDDFNVYLQSINK